jgi:hypothetical protein
MTTETVQHATRRLLESHIRRGYVPSGLHVYVNPDGQPIYWRVRLERPDGDKVIRPIRLNGNGYELGEPRFPSHSKPLYNLDQIAADDKVPIFVVEGEKCADAINVLGGVATTSGGASSDGDADWMPLKGRVCCLWADNDDNGRAYMGRVAQKLLMLGCAVELVDIDALNLPPKGDVVDWLAAHPNARLGDVLSLPRVKPLPRPIDATASVLERPRAVVRRLSEIEAKPIRWLWPGRIARGKVSLIAGHPGLGKSQIATALTSVVTTGGTWPADGSVCEAGSVVMLNAEDDAADTIRPRLEAAGADVKRCVLVDAVVVPTGSLGSEQRGFNLKSDLAVLDDVLTENRGVALVVIDPLTAYLANVDSHVNADVRGVLAPLGELAARHGVAVVCVTHLNKGGPSRGGSGDALLRVSGSLAFVAAARAAYVVVSDNEDKRRRLFLPVKNNIGNDTTGLAFTVQPHALPSGIETSRVLWEAQPVTVTADEAMAPPPNETDRTMTEEAADLLRDMLARGRALARDIKRAATDSGISEKALRTARERVGVKIEREGVGADHKVYYLWPDAPLMPSCPTPAPTRNRAPVDSEGKSGSADGEGDPPQTRASGRRWRITRANGESFLLTTPQATTRAELAFRYPGAGIEGVEEVG